MTLRGLADATGVDFTYLSKIENGRPGYFPGAETIRELATALRFDALELLHLANKLPPELEKMAGDPKARRFFQRRATIRSDRRNKETR